MMNEELYEKIEHAFLQYRIEEEVEDVLLELAELIADRGPSEKEVCIKEKYGKAVIEVCGICSAGEEDEEEPSVLIRRIKIGTQEFEIDDYLL